MLPYPHIHIEVMLFYFLLQKPQSIIEVLILLRAQSDDVPIYPLKVFFLQ